jgi:hypothetical protein
LRHTLVSLQAPENSDVVVPPAPQRRRVVLFVSNCSLCDVFSLCAGVPSLNTGKLLA